MLWSSLALWARSTKNPDESTGPLARPFAHSLTLLTRLLAPPCSLCLRAPLTRSLRSLFACGKVSDKMAIFSCVFSILDHSAWVVLSGVRDGVGARILAWIFQSQKGSRIHQWRLRGRQLQQSRAGGQGQQRPKVRH